MKRMDIDEQPSTSGRRESCREVVDAKSGRPYFLHVLHSPADDTEESSFDLVATDGSRAWTAPGGGVCSGGGAGVCAAAELHGCMQRGSCRGVCTGRAARAKAGRRRQGLRVVVCTTVRCKKQQ